MIRSHVKSAGCCETKNAIPSLPTTSVMASVADKGCVSIVFVIDKSGSMGTIAPRMREAINTFITEQQRQPRDGSTFTCYMFADNVERTVHRQPLCQVRLLSAEDYRTGGSTALFDALGTACHDFAHERNVILVVVTDGEENASRRFTKKEEITRMIAQCKDEKKWNVIYLSCDIDTFAQGQAMGMTNSLQSANVRQDRESMPAFMSNTLSQAVTRQRQTGESAAFLVQTANTGPTSTTNSVPANKVTTTTTPTSRGAGGAGGAVPTTSSRRPL